MSARFHADLRTWLLVASTAGLLGHGSGCNGEEGAEPIAGSASREPKPIAVLVSGDTTGWIVPCGCATNQSGGLLRRASFVADARQRNEVVLLDVGGAPAGTSPYERAKFEAILAGELEMGVAAHNLGGPEIALGPVYLREAASKTRMHFISANATDQEGAPLAAAHRLIQVSGRRIAVIGVVSPKFATSEVRISEPREAVLTVREQLGDSFDWLMVLAYLAEEELREFAAALPEADVVIGGPTGQSIAPMQVGPVLLASATNKGKFVVSLKPPDSQSRPRWEGAITEITDRWPDDAAQRKNLARFRASLGEHDFTAAESGLSQLALVSVPLSYRLAGTDACRDCHQADCQVWEASGHAHAWETLADQGAHVDSYCQQCHTTGFGLPGGFESARRSLPRTDVGCESCHGPSQSHVKEPTIRTPLIARDQCVHCHDRENSPEFDFAKYWESIVHGEAVAAELTKADRR